MRATFSFLGLLAGCSSVTQPDAEAVLLTDPQASVWFAMPPPATVSIDVIVESSQQRANVAQGPMPDASAGRINLGDPGVVDFGTVAHFETVGFDQSGAPSFRGRTIPFYLNGIAGLQVPLFVGRTGSWSRPPAPQNLAHVHPPLGIMQNGFLVATGGEATAGANPMQVEVYDLGLWGPLQVQPTLPQSAKTIVVVGPFVLLIDDTGATWFSLYDGSVQQAAPPADFQFADVAGGDVVAAGDSQYVVGATRPTGDPTAQILRVKNDDRSLSVVSLTTPRTGAAASTVRGILYVSSGGGPVESCSPPIPCAPLPSPGQGDTPDTTVGAALVEGAVAGIPSGGPDASSPMTDDGGIATRSVAFVVGGIDPSNGEAMGIRTFDLDCSGDACGFTTQAALPALTRTRAAIIGTGAAQRLLTVGETADGQDHAFLFDPTAAPPTMPVEFEFREPRKSAGVILCPNGTFGVVGGTSVATGAAVLSLEFFTLP